MRLILPDVCCGSSLSSPIFSDHLFKTKMEQVDLPDDLPAQLPNPLPPLHSHGVRKRILRFRTQREIQTERQKAQDFGNALLGHGQGDLKMPVPGATSESVAKASKFSLKFPGPKVTPIDIDRAGPQFALNSAERNRFIKDLVEDRLANGDDDLDVQRALEFLHSKILEPELLTEAENEFWIDFCHWLVAQPRVKEDRDKTPWLRPDAGNLRPIEKNLSMALPEVGKFVRIFGDTREEFQRQLDELRIRGPVNLTESYLYFKYIVRGESGDFLDDFQYFWKPPPDGGGGGPGVGVVAEEGDGGVGGGGPPIVVAPLPVDEPPREDVGANVQQIAGGDDLDSDSDEGEADQVGG